MMRYTQVMKVASEVAEAKEKALDGGEAQI